MRDRKHHKGGHSIARAAYLKFWALNKWILRTPRSISFYRLNAIIDSALAGQVAAYQFFRGTIFK
jgi:hypothetical protein